MTVLIRSATTHDIDAIARMEAELMGADAWSPGIVRGEVNPALRGVVVAEDTGAGQLVGYAVMLVLGETADLQRIGVAPAHQRQGIATQLLDALLAGLGPRVSRVMLEVRADNTAAIAFYEQHGFEWLRRRTAYYADGTDAHVMLRRLTTATLR